MSGPSQKQPDQQRIVASLAAESRTQIGFVATLYERERAALASGAHITNFIHIFVTRKVREILRKHAGR
jgi:hypothetical protein